MIIESWSYRIWFKVRETSSSTCPLQEMSFQPEPDPGERGKVTQSVSGQNLKFPSREEDNLCENNLLASNPSRELVARDARWTRATVWTQSWIRTHLSLHQSETTDISKSGVPLAKGLSQFCSSIQPGKPLSKVTYFFLWDQAIRMPVNMDLPCFLLSPHGKRQVPTVSLRKASSLGETEEWQEAAWDTCTLYVCSFALSFTQISSVSFCHCMPSSPSSYVSEATTGLVAQRGTHGAHTSRAFSSAGESVVGFSPDPSRQCFRAAEQKTRAVGIQQSSAGAARQSLVISE